jgi:hypothetical protein
MIGYQDYVMLVNKLKAKQLLFNPRLSVLPEIAIIKKYINRYKKGK